MTDRRAWTWCLAAGVLAFVASFLFGRVPGLAPCGPSPQGLGAVLGFEAVRSPAEVAALFGADPCRSALVAAQRTGLLLDGLWFIPAYTVFLMAGALAAHRAAGRWLAGLALVAGLSDQVEGALLWQILDRLPGTPEAIGALFWAVCIKFGLLVFVTSFIGLSLCTIGRPWVARVAGVVLMFAGLAAATALGRNDWAGMMRWLGIGWPALLLAALIGAVRPASLAARGDPPPVPAPPAP